MDNTKTPIKKIDIREGTIAFWIPENKIVWNDNKTTVLFNISVNDKGSLFLVKDDDNRLKFSHIIIGKGRTDVEIDASELSSEERHHIATTWSLKNKKIELYINGGKIKDEQSINYN